MGMGNTVGSREPCIAFTARKQQVLWVTPHQLEILIGCILGDAHVTPRGQVRIEHSKKQNDYILWKYKKLRSISYPNPPQSYIIHDRRTDEDYKAMRFSTRQYFRPLRSKFYQESRKIFPLKMKISALTLAVWYMDDGHFERKKKRAILATDNFTKNEIKIITNLISQLFGVSGVIRKSGKLVFAGHDCAKFFEIIDQYIIESMRYKVC